MSQTILLNQLIDKRRNKFWEMKSLSENDWQKGLLQIELAALNKSIKYLQHFMVTKK